MAIAEGDDRKQDIEAQETEKTVVDTEKNFADVVFADERFEIDIAEFEKSIGTAIENIRDINIDQELLLPLKITIPKIDLEEIVYEDAG